MRQLIYRLALLAATYFATGWLGLRIPYVGAHITLVWLPTGIAVAALLRWGKAVLPGVYLGAFLVNLAIGSPMTLAASIAIGNTLGPALTAGWLRRLGFLPGFERQRDVGLFVLAAAGGMAVSALCGVASLALAGLLPGPSAGFALLAWWMGDAVGVLLAAPLALNLTRDNARLLGRTPGELLLWLAAASVVAWLAFIHDYANLGHTLPLAFTTLPLLAWAAVRFGIIGAALAGLGFSVLAAWSTATGHGTFFMPDAHVSLVLLWSYMAITVLTGLLVTALQAERLHVEATLRSSEQKLRGLYELSPLGIALTDMHGHFLDFNEAFRAICGYPEDELKAIDYWTLTPKQYEADEARQLESLQRCGHYGPYQKEYRRKDGSLVPINLNGVLLHGADGHSYIWSIVEDVTEKRRAEAALQQTTRDLNNLIARMPAGVYKFRMRHDDGIQFDYVSPRFCELLEVEADVVYRDPYAAFAAIHPAELDGFIRLNGKVRETLETFRWEGRLYEDARAQWLHIESSPTVMNNGDILWDGIIYDISSAKQQEARLQKMAHYDELTGIPNRGLLTDRMNQAITQSQRTGAKIAVCYLDLDGFKPINDTYGHAAGDQLLIEIARRLRTSLRASDTVARIGGDEFVLLMPGIESTDEIEESLRRILERVRQAVDVGGRQVSVSCSVGVTHYPHDPGEPDSLLRHADEAMLQAKQLGKNKYCFYLGH
ncbi:MAG TPA: diguanylate cyclase [Burkholderiaceae bacterium]|nr:diguanylate cyclase [Burkholderiaceae bacterium]